MSRSCRPSWPTCATLLDASDIRSLVSRKLRMILSSGEFRNLLMSLALRYTGGYNRTG